MWLEVGSHLDEARLEQYSMGTLPEEAQAAFEEHLLACGECQDRLLETDAYINAVRAVSPRLRSEHEQRRERWAAFRESVADLLRGKRRLVWATSFAVVALVMAVIRPWQERGGAQPFAVVLESSRGIEGLIAARAPAGRPLILEIDLTQLPAAARYRLEIVNAMGRRQWEGSAPPSGGRIAAATGARLAAGTYFVRLYISERELLREFSLQVQ